jgi:lysophospholipase L1-like esterase
VLNRALLVLGGLAAGVAFLVAAELVLRWSGLGCALRRDPFAGFSNVVPLFEPAVRPDGTRIFRTTEAFRSEGAQEFAAEKPPGGLRAFVVGESSAAGVPYPKSEAFSGWLERRLRAELPQAHIEVVNAAHSGYASRRIAAVVREISQYDPDLLIVYCGHNEYGERRFFAHLLEMDPRLFRLWELLASTRLYCLISRAWEGVRPETTAAPQFEFDEVNNASQMFAVAARRARGDFGSDRELAYVELHYRHNLEEMARIMKDAGARTVFVTLSQNFSDWPPAASSHRAGLGAAELAAYDREVAAGDALARDGAGCTAALDAWDRARAIDDKVADLHWRKAGCERTLGRLAEARESYRRASDLDLVPHGASTRLNEIVREVARETDSLLVDADRVLERESGPRLVGDDLFTDMMHPNLRGHQLISAAVAESLREAGIPRPADEWQVGAYVDPDPEAFLASRPELRIRERLVRAGACLLSQQFECAEREARATLALDPTNGAAQSIAEAAAQRRAGDARVSPPRARDRRARRPGGQPRPTFAPRS